MIYFALFMTGAFMFGLVTGVVCDGMLRRDEIIALEKKNARLHAQLTKIKRQNVETIEIIDHRAEPESYFAPF